MVGLFLKNGNVIDVVRKTIRCRDFWVESGKITFIRPKEKPLKTINLNGSYVSAGFIDGHIHIESSMLPPLEFAYEAVKHGTTSVFADPRKLVNGFGEKGIQLFLDQADIVPFTMNIAVPARVSVPAVEEFLKNEKVYGLAEVMDFAGVISGKGDVRKKVRLALESGKIVDGHCPAISGEDLKKYISNGEPDRKIRIGSDHESVNYYEALEKWENGMYVMMRHGSFAKDFENIFPEICGNNLCFNEFGIVSDELSAEDLRRNGHVNYVVDMAIEIIRKEKKYSLVKAAIEAISLATINHARHFRQNTGRIEEGAVADIIAFNSLEKIMPHLVISRGRIVVEKYKHTKEKPAYDYKKYRNPLNLTNSLAKDFVVTSNKKKQMVRVIDVSKGDSRGNEVLVELSVKEKLVRLEPERGILKMAARESRDGAGNMTVGFIKGINLENGAIAATTANDNNSLVVTGTNETSMIRAVEKIRQMGGGIAVVSNGRSEALPLSVGGIMSPADINSFLRNYKRLLHLINARGVKSDPIPTLLGINLPKNPFHSPS
ncbi:MAG: adenine deaminase C-terminal domain-containing protein [Candidatus Omnitrophota bacterium]